MTLTIPRLPEPKRTMAVTEGAEPGFVIGGGEMGERVRAFDWSMTSLGPIENWSPSLKMMVRFLLANRFPMLLWWGPDFIQIYNDAYRPVLGAKHPSPGLGHPVRECWSEIWHILEPLIEAPFKGGAATWMEDIALEINRHGFIEETHFTIAYSPVPDETVSGGIGGVLATVHEITEKVVGERRVVALRDLGARVGDAKTAEEACRIAAQTLVSHDKDVPFALLYLLEADGKRARLSGASCVCKGKDFSPEVVEIDAAHHSAWPLVQALRSGTMRVVENLDDRFETVPRGPWADPPRTAVVVPIPSNKAGEPAGVMIAGVSARLKFDSFYRDFFELVRTQVATAIANARAYEEERQRAEALAEIDRAKTAFFSNVSHEFRTPLTLMLGPIEELLALSKGVLPASATESLNVAHRNSLRLLKLVNTLLDFTRIEAGRIDASYEPTDLAAYTAELASTFRSALEKAGLRLVVDCPALPEPVYVDREMWEKIVLNLVGNAFKFTFQGEIKVALTWRGGEVALSVSDTGVGISEKELPKIFERFHRVRGTRARSNEGTGIGLALVQELVRLHGGEVKVRSVQDHGSVFTVSIRTGTGHLPAEQIQKARKLDSTSLGAAPFVDEAMRWLPPDFTEESEATREQSASAREVVSTTATAADAPRIVLADDNSDMREYVTRLLRPHYEVICAADGQGALKAAMDYKPDLILSDVMMPGLDGFGLLCAVRADEALRGTPVILLSARAGEESRIEGLDVGADDYLTKPFSARELLARVGGQVALSRLRRQSEAKLREAQAKLAQANEELSSRAKQLDQLVEQRTAQLHSSNEQLEAFVYSIAHDLRAPLRSMTGFSEALINEHGRELSDTARSMLKRVQGSSEFMDRLLMDLLAYSRAARADIELSSVHVRKALGAALFQCENEMQLAGATIDAALATGLVLAHQATLGQCLANLLSNAIKFVAPEVKPSIRIWTEKSGARLRIWLADNGIGIPPQHRDRIFKVFERLNGKLYPGTGIGLAIVQKGVERMGGRVGLESKPGEGSRFWIELASPVSD